MRRYHPDDFKQGQPYRLKTVQHQRPYFFRQLLRVVCLDSGGRLLVAEFMEQANDGGYVPRLVPVRGGIVAEEI
jgi:hypothetical protein